MYRIEICDDDSDCLQEICQLTEKILTRHEIDFELTRFSSIPDLAERLQEKDCKLHLLLMDILFEESNGIELARTLRTYDSNCGIIFISVCTDYILDGYDVQAIKYLLKPVDEEALEKAILYDYENNFKERMLKFRRRCELEAIRQNDILYIESTGHTVRVHSSDGRVVETYAKLTDIERQLPSKQFSRCHNSICVNLEQVRKITRTQVKLSNGETLPISKSKLKSFQESFLRYI